MDNAVSSRARSGPRFVTRSRVALAVALLVILAVVLFVTLNTTARPAIQVPLDMQGMPPHRLNVWTLPNPPTLGTVEFIAQVVDAGGNPRNVTSVRFAMFDSTGQRETEALGTPLRSTNRGDAGRFQATVQTMTAGPTELEVAVTMSGRVGIVRVPFEIRDDNQP